MNPIRWFLILALSAATLQVGRASESDPADVVRALYKLDIKNNGFDAARFKRERPYIAPDLYARILKDLNQPVAPGDEGFIEEDLILNAQDDPTQYSVGKATIEQGTAKVPVDLAWDSEKLHYTVFLKQFDGAWKVTQIDYGKDGKLTDMLN